jgi:hypothetical protein
MLVNSAWLTLLNAKYGIIGISPPSKYVNPMTSAEIHALDSAGLASCNSKSIMNSPSQHPPHTSLTNIITYLNPHILILLQCLHNRTRIRPRNLIVAENLVDLFLLGVRHLPDFAPLARLFDLEVLGFGFGGQPGAQTHADGAGEELGGAADDDDVRGAGAETVLVGWELWVGGKGLGDGDARCETGGQGERHGETICKSDDGVAEDFGVSFVLLGVVCHLAFWIHCCSVLCDEPGWAPKRLLA